jgi:putative oxidoreductase
MARLYARVSFRDRRAVVTKYLQAQSKQGGRMDLGRTALRLVIGPLFVGHGTQKLFGWFGGHGRDGTGAFFEQIGLKPGKRHATGAGAAEAVGGALLTLGALTPVAAGLITGTMITAIRKVHLEKGPWVTNGGYEYNLTLIAAVLALTEAGPGRPSVDASVFPRLKGNALALTAFAASAAGATLLTSERFTPAEHTQAEGEGELPGDPAAPRQERFTREGAEVSTGAQ